MQKKSSVSTILLAEPSNWTCQRTRAAHAAQGGSIRCRLTHLRTPHRSEMVKPGAASPRSRRRRPQRGR